ncbi:hypothetical protein [Neobacillus mesonae]|uniref:hypothetical protein n=1 Tax=Neobacillus mesonae TaxID=1193713 RepID=UPI002E1F68EA|nr:hypothetical protein [Neobacillus mesonae]
MRQVFRFDKDGYFVEPVIIMEGETIPFDCTEKDLPQPCWKPKFDGVRWIEMATEEEKKPPAPPKSEIDILREQNALLKAQNIALSERADFIEDVIAEMAMQVYP